MTFAYAFKNAQRKESPSLLTSTSKVKVLVDSVDNVGDFGFWGQNCRNHG